MMLMIQSKDGNVKVVATGTVTDICADTATAIHGLAGQLIQPFEDTAHKNLAFEMLRSAIDYAIDTVEMEEHA